jgi:hypothetical protein
MPTLTVIAAAEDRAAKSTLTGKPRAMEMHRRQPALLNEAGSAGG